MRRTFAAAVVAAGLAWVLTPRAVEAGIFNFKKAACEEPAGEPKQIDAPDHDFCRAGYPNELSKHAHPSNTNRFWGGYVGGGAAVKGEGRYCGDGTWGWDYVGGCPFHHRVFLGWWHGRKYQGGSGAYRQDGPEFPRPPHIPEIGRHKTEGH
jgi:hypothetical protein